MKKALAGTVCCLVLACVAMGETKLVKLKDGRTITGEVTTTADGYQVQTKFGVMTFTKDQVKSVESAAMPDKEYEERLAKIDPKKPEDHYGLAEWAIQKGMLDVAKKELQAALTLKPNYEQATLLMRQVDARIQAADSRNTGGEVKTPDTGAGSTGTVVSGSTAAVPKEWLVSEEDIARIRQEELQATDNVTVKFKNDVLDRFIKSQKGSDDFQTPAAAQQFRNLAPARQAAYILGKVDRDDTAIKDDIQIKSDPKSMADFRSVVWPVVSQQCAGFQCHGGEKGNGNLKLFVGVRSDAMDYTNFIILDGFTTKAGDRMIDRDRPEQSLLLQFGLPEGQSSLKHPKQIPVVFPNRTGGNYQKIQTWIQSLRGPKHPDYRLQYSPPLGMKLNFGGLALPVGDDKPAVPPAPVPPPVAPVAPPVVPPAPPAAPADPVAPPQ